VGPIVKLA